MSTTEFVWAVALTFAVIAVMGVWFLACGYADRRRRAREFAKSTFLYAGVGFAIGIAFLTSDLGSPQPQGRLGMVALTVGCFLLLYSAGWGLVAANDKSRVVVNLTGRPLLLADPSLAPFYTLPAPRDEPAIDLPPERPRTYYIVSAELGRIGAEAGRTDVFIVDTASASETRDGPLLVRRLLRAVPLPPFRDGAES